MSLINKFYTRLGFNALVSEQFDKAEHYFLKICKKTSYAMGSNHNLGLVYFAAGKFSSARDCFLKEIESFGPTYSRVKALGDVYYEMKDAQNSKIQYNSAIELGSNQPDLAMVKTRIDICKDNELFKKASLSTAICKKGILAEETEDFSQALTYYIDAVEKDPSNIQALNNAGACCERLKDLKKARFYFNQAFKLSGLPVIGKNLKKIDNAISKLKDA